MSCSGSCSHTTLGNASLLVDRHPLHVHILTPRCRSWRISRMKIAVSSCSFSRLTELTIYQSMYGNIVLPRNAWLSFTTKLSGQRPHHTPLSSNWIGNYVLSRFRLFCKLKDLALWKPIKAITRSRSCLLCRGTSYLQFERRVRDV